MKDHRKMLKLQEKMTYPQEEIDAMMAKIQALEQKQHNEARKACNGIQDNLAATQSRLAKHIAAKEKRIEEHNADLAKHLDKKCAGLAQIEAEWKVNKTNIEAEAEREMTKSRKAIQLI